MAEVQNPEENVKQTTFISIRVSSLQMDTVTAFDLYIRSKSGQDPVLYRERNLSFTAETLERLASNNVEWLFISSRQEGEYTRYLEDHLDTILADENVPLTEKCEILYTSAQGLVHELMDNPPGCDEISRSKKLVEESVQFLSKQKDALKHLMQLTSHDYYTYTHSVNVFVYTISLAQRVGFNDKAELNDFLQGALLHDVGKSLIDQDIVNFKGKLNKYQWDLLKRHPIYGYEILSKDGGLGKVGLDVVRHHHEKLDGSGYPDGLSGKAISPFVAISTITDIFDALTTRRPYRKPLASFPALRLMQREFKGQLDPSMFSAFVQMMGTS